MPTTLIFLFYDAFESLAHSYLSLPTVGNDPKMIITGVLKTAMETLRWSVGAEAALTISRQMDWTMLLQVLPTPLFYLFKKQLVDN